VIGDLMASPLPVLGGLAVWLLLQRVVLPRLGIST